VIITSTIAMVIISWYRVLIAGTIMVDGHGLHGWPEALVFISFILSLGFFSVAYYRLWANRELCLSDIKPLAFVLIGIFSFMLPMLSNDIFSYMVFGDAANKGADVYTNTQCMHVSSYFSYITRAWASSTCAYGPVILLLAMTAAWMGAGKIVLTLVTYKILVLLTAFVFVELAARVSLLMQAPVRCFTFIVLNPVFLLQGVGQLHADLIAITFTLAGIYFLFSNKWYLSFVMVALAIATKMNYVLILPFFLMGLWLQGQQRAGLFGRAASGLLILVVSLIAAYAPFYTSAETITTPFKFHFSQNPSKCIGEVLSYIIYFAPQIITGHPDRLKDTVNVTSGPDTQVYIAKIIVKICQVFALLSSLYILVKYLVGEQSLKQWFRVYVRTLLLFLLYYMHIFNPWYLMMLLPFMWVDDEPVFMQWLFVLTCFISVQDIVCTVSRNSLIYEGVLGLTFISVMLYMYKPMRMFFTSLGY